VPGAVQGAAVAAETTGGLRSAASVARMIR